MEPVTTSDSRHSEPSAAIVREAAEWLAHLESGDASEQDLHAFDSWRLAAPAHAVALDRMGGLRGRLDAAPQVERETLRRLLSRPKPVLGRASLAIVAAVGLGWMASRLPAVQLQFADQKTRPGETRVVALADGSRLTLSTDSAANIDVRGDRRTVRLLRGEVLAQVARRDGAAFTVVSQDGTAVALGTAFTVRKEAASTTVSIAESHVRVCPDRNDDKTCATLTPGQRARLSHGGLDRLSDVPADSVGAWRDGWLSVEDRPLAEVLDELNQWRAAPLGFDRRSIEDLRVSGVFPLHEPDKAVANLTALLPIRVDRSDPAAPVVRRR